MDTIGVYTLTQLQADVLVKDWRIITFLSLCYRVYTMRIDNDSVPEYFHNNDFS